MSLWAIWSTVLFVLCLCCPHAAADQEFNEDFRVLTSTPHRLTGTAEGRRAADYVEKRLCDMGIRQVFVQEFSVPQTKIIRCEIIITDTKTKDTVRRKLLPMRPNGIIPPVTSPEGLSGHLLYAGAGTIDEFKSQLPTNAIVVLDYNSDQGWRRAFRLGAKAVIFIRNGPTKSHHALHSEASVNLPRFFYPGNPKDLQGDTKATVHSEIIWESRTGRNVFALLPGTQPVFHLEKEELIILAANLDSFGEIPRNSPGARGGANCAALLKLARFFHRNRSRRHILLAFYDGGGRGQSGTIAFYRALEKNINALLPESRWNILKTERDFLNKMTQSLEESGDTSRTSDIHHILTRKMLLKVADRVSAISAQMAILRRSMKSLKRNDPLRKKNKAGLERMQNQKSNWNDMRRALAKGKDTKEWLDLLELVHNEIRRDLEIRLRELSDEERSVRCDEAIKNAIGDYWFSLHASLILGDTSPVYGVTAGGESYLHSTEDHPGLYGRILRTFHSAWKDLVARGMGPSNFLSASVDGSLSPSRMILAAPRISHSGEPAGKRGIYNLIIGTCQERLIREGTPDDKPAALDTKRIENQATSIGHLLLSVANHEGLSLRSSIVASREYYFPEFRVGLPPRGPRLMGKAPGSSLFNKPISNAIIQFFHSNRNMPHKNSIHIPGFENFQTVRADYNGSYTFGPAPKSKRRDIFNGFAADFDSRGVIDWASTTDTAGKCHSRLNMIKAHHGVIVLPPQFVVAEAKVFNAISKSPLDETKSYQRTFDGLAYWYCEKKIKSTQVFGLDSVVALNNGSENLLGDEDGYKSEGRGFDLGQTMLPMESAGRSAVDLWRLDESRMKIQRARGVMNSSVEELHGRVEDLLKQAESSREVKRKDALKISAFWGEKPAYTNTRNALDDLVKAVLVLLALSVPFAFALERLIIGSTTIYKQLAGFAIFFIATFLLLYFSHPAFAISNTPLIIFLGFTVVVLSSMVIILIMQKFENELKAMQGLTSTVHSVDVSRFSTVMAAMNMGISTMRRRPVRTLLTAVTIILLTFTILCFASFDMHLGVRKVFSDLSPRYTGVFINSATWTPIPDDTLSVIEGRWPSNNHIYPRYWLSPRVGQTQGLLVTGKNGKRSVSMRGVLGMNPGELKHRADFTRSLPASDIESGLIMTQAAIDNLGAKPGDTVLVGGIRLRLCKPMNDIRISALTDINGSSILPVDFTSEQTRQSQSEATAVLDVSPQSKWAWSYLPVDSIIIVSVDTARRLGAKLHSIAVYTDNATVSQRMAEQMARIMPLMVTATREDGVYLHSLGPVLAASGVKDLVFPILLGGLVVFGTMLGSIADREREIYTFSALGLAPPHVASLFFAEAMIYSVLGGLGGYLLAQGSMECLGRLAAYGLVDVPVMNYSSTNAIVTILIVMATVLISAIYPAIKASRSANPGLLRTWRLPAPSGDTFNITFPFTVSEYDFTGVVSFLLEHFNNFQDVGLGDFMTEESRLIRWDDNTVGLESKIALSPFDLGVTQSFLLRSQPSEIPGINEVHIRLVRISGQPRDWQRLNKRLLNDLRRQMLIWRSLPQETMETYRERTLVAMNNMPQTSRRDNQ